MNFTWSNYALQDLNDIYSFIAEEDHITASNVVNKIIENAENILKIFPFGGKKGRVAGTRELVLTKTSYVIVYRVNESSLIIVAVLHGRREWPKSFL